MYERGDGVAKNEAEAVAWYRQAAARGNRKAQDELSKRGLNWSAAAPAQVPAATVPSGNAPPAVPKLEPID